MTLGLELVVLHTTPSIIGKFLVHAWRSCGGLKNILYQFIKDQTHVGMPRGPKMSMALAEPKQVALRSKLNTTSEHTPQVERNY